MRLRIAAALVLLVVGLGAVVVVVLKPGSTTTSTQLLTGTATTTDVVQEVSASGTLGASNTYGLAFGSDPRIVSSATSAAGSGGNATWVVRNVTVALGETVKAGQVLATADTGDAARALALAQANLATAQARVATDLGGPAKADKASAYDQVRQAQQNLNQAVANQKTTKAQNALKLSQTKSALATAQAKLAADIAAGPASTLIDGDQAAVTQAQQALDSLSLQIQAADIQAASNVQQLDLKLTQARTALATAQAKLVSDLLTLTDPSAVLDADRATIVQDQAQVDTLVLQVQAANQSNSITSQQNNQKVSQAQATLTTAQVKLASDIAAGPAASLISADQSAVTQAQQALDTLTVSIAASNQQATSQVTSSQLSLTSSIHGYSTKIAPAAAAQLAADQASESTAQAAVDSAQSSLDAATITAPASGVVSAISIVPGILAPSGDAIQIQVEPLQVTASVAESDRPKLRIGQTASVTISADGQTVGGHVTAISPVASGGQSSVVSYPITVVLDQTPTDAAVGMSADVTITIDQATGVVAVPTAAVVTSAAGTSTVRVVDTNGQVETRQVVVGLVSRTLVEIKSGVSAGETVVIGSSTTRTSTSTGAGAIGGGGGFDGGGGGVLRP